MATDGTSGYRSLKVWEKAVDLAVALHKRAALFPEAEKYALTSQLQRAAYSVSLNLAEGNAMGTARAKRHAIDLSRGSLAEVETLLTISDRLGYIDSSEYLPRCEEIGRMLLGLRRSVVSRAVASHLDR